MKNKLAVLPDENPKERFLKVGKEHLMTHELIALLIQSNQDDLHSVNLAKQIHKRFKWIRSIRKASMVELMQLNGIGPIKAMRLLAALELGKRLQKETFEEKQFLGTADHVYLFLKDDLETLDQEHFVVLYLDTKGFLIEAIHLFKGSLNASIVHQREIFKHAVRLSAFSFIMVHNHPSGNPEPSRADKAVTAAVEQAADIMGIACTDHIIIGANQYYSFKAKHRFNND